jgi:hypothetical protein
MKSELLAGVIAVVLSIPALAATQTPQSAAPQAAAGLSEVVSVTTPMPSLPMLGNTPYVAFGFGDPGGLAPLDLNAPVTRVVTAPPPVATSTEGDDEVEPAASPPMETSTYALMLASLAVLLYIANRLRQD